MEGFAAALIGGPDWHVDHAPRGAGRLRSVPLVLLALGILAAAGFGVVNDGLAPVLAASATAASSTLLSVVLASPALLLGARRAWLLPLFVAVSGGAAGWASIGGFWQPWLREAGLLLPLMVLCLAGIGAKLPRGLAESAACAGASRRAVVFRLLLPLALPGLVRCCALVWLLAAGLALG